MTDMHGLTLLQVQEKTVMDDALLWFSTGNVY